MNPTKHCQISVKRWGGSEQDYLEIHSFIDHTKSICCDMRHRILHNMWAVHNIVVPVFGHTIVNSEGREVDVKDLCERDHLLVDYHNRFIPNLSDFVETIDDTQLPETFRRDIEDLHSRLPHRDQVSKLLLSPLSASGRFKSLLITHNSWFINHLLPMVFDTKPLIDDFALPPSTLFNAMKPELWMDNGISHPPSFNKLREKLI